MLSEDIQKHGSQGCRTDAWRKMYDEWADKVAKLERVARAAKTFEGSGKQLILEREGHKDWMELKAALADLPEDALGG